MFRPNDLHRLSEIATVIGPMPPGDPAMTAALNEATVLVTGWGTPGIGPSTLAAAPQLKCIAHSAGSVKHLVGDHTYDRGIRVITAAAANAIPVAEFTIATMVSLLKQMPWIADAYAENDTAQVKERMNHVRELTDMEVGLIGASRIGRHVSSLLRCYTNITIKMYDPYLSDNDAADLGVYKTTLEEVCRCEVVSVHAPNLPQTHHIINAQRLALMPDHAVFINTARGALVDEAALIDEMTRRPIYALLDVTDPEPPSPDSPLRNVPNLILAPHVAGARRQGCREMGKLAIDEIIRFLSGQPLQHEVTREMLATQA